MIEALNSCHILSLTDPILQLTLIQPVWNYIHLFVDASKKTYGSVAFLLLQQQTSFGMTKTRVAPLKSLILPRLELMAALATSQVYHQFTQTPGCSHLHMDI